MEIEKRIEKAFEEVLKKAEILIQIARDEVKKKEVELVEAKGKLEEIEKKFDNLKKQVKD